MPHSPIATTAMTPKAGSFLRVRIQCAVNRASDRASGWMDGWPWLRLLIRRRGSGPGLYGCELAGFEVDCRSEFGGDGDSNLDCDRDSDDDTDRDGGGIEACAAKEA